jgi:hypothetical protein
LEIAVAICDDVLRIEIAVAESRVSSERVMTIDHSMTRLIGRNRSRRVTICVKVPSFEALLGFAMRGRLESARAIA